MKKHEPLAEFIQLCQSTQDKTQLSALLNFFLTPEECADIETRVLLIKELLREKKTQREIAKDSHISIAKITRGSNELKKIDIKLLTFLKEQLL